MSQIKIYHNPRCSKSRKTLEIIQQKGLEPTIIKYVETAPTVVEIKKILLLLGIEPRALMRKSEKEYKDNNMSDETLSTSQLVGLMHKFPKVIERPIVLANNKAVIGRPPESVLDIL